MTTAIQGYAAKVCAEPGASPHTFDVSSEPYEFKSFTVSRKDNILDTEGIRGTRSRHSVNTRLGTYAVSGNMVWNPTVADLVLWLPRICGVAPSSTTFALGDDLATTGIFGLLHDNSLSTFEYTDCMVNKATFRCQAGGLLELDLEIFGKTEVIGTGYPALTLGTTAVSNSPFVMSDGVFTYVTAARDTLSWEMVIDNMLDVRFSNSRTATSITAKDRLITSRTTHPYIAALYNQAVGGTTGTAVFTNSTVSLTFTYGVLQAPSVGPVVNGKGETVLQVDAVARMTGSTKELVVTLDSTV